VQSLLFFFFLFIEAYAPSLSSPCFSRKLQVYLQFFRGQFLKMRVVFHLPICSSLFMLPLPLLVSFCSFSPLSQPVPLWCLHASGVGRLPSLVSPPFPTITITWSPSCIGFSFPHAFLFDMGPCPFPLSYLFSHVFGEIFSPLLFALPPSVLRTNPPPFHLSVFIVDLFPSPFASHCSPPLPTYSPLRDFFPPEMRIGLPLRTSSEFPIRWHPSLRTGVLRQISHFSRSE